MIIDSSGHPASANIIQSKKLSPKRCWRLWQRSVSGQFLRVSKNWRLPSSMTALSASAVVIGASGNSGRPPKPREKLAQTPYQQQPVGMIQKLFVCN